MMTITTCNNYLQSSKWRMSGVKLHTIDPSTLSLHSSPRLEPSTPFKNQHTKQLDKQYLWVKSCNRFDVSVESDSELTQLHCALSCPIHCRIKRPAMAIEIRLEEYILVRWSWFTSCCTRRILVLTSYQASLHRHNFATMAPVDIWSPRDHRAIHS